MGPETCHAGCESRQFFHPPLHNRVTTYNFRAACRHLVDAGRFAIGSLGLLMVFFWLLMTRRLDSRVSAWSVMAGMARRSLRIYGLPGRLLRALLRRDGGGNGIGQGNTA